MDLLCIWIVGVVTCLGICQNSQNSTPKRVKFLYVHQITEGIKKLVSPMQFFDDMITGWFPPPKWNTDLHYLPLPGCSTTMEPSLYPNNLLLVFVVLLLFLIFRQTFYRILSV